MHKYLLKKYYFIKNFDKAHLIKLDRKIEIIYRNHKNPNDLAILTKISEFCKIYRRKFYISNNVKLAIKLKADGVYFSAFNTNMRHRSFKVVRKFNLIGSAHNISEINLKKKQGVDIIFLCPVFKRKGKALGSYGFIKLRNLSKRKCVILGGINSKNIKQINFLNAYGFAAIDYFEKKKAPFK